MKHSGDINSICFFDEKNMFSASNDNTIAIWNISGHIGQWESYVSLKGHKEHVLSFSVHPSGKIGISASLDKTIKLWNLIKGSCAYSKSFSKTPQIVKFSPNGELFVVLFDKEIILLKPSDSEFQISFKHKEIIWTVEFLNSNILVAGGEAKTLFIYDIEKQQEIAAIENFHENRIKGLSHDVVEFQNKKKT